VVVLMKLLKLSHVGEYLYVQYRNLVGKVALPGKFLERTPNINSSGVVTILV